MIVECPQTGYMRSAPKSKNYEGTQKLYCKACDKMHEFNIVEKYYDR